MPLETESDQLRKLYNIVQKLEQRVAALEHDSHPPADLVPAVTEIVRQVLNESEP